MGKKIMGAPRSTLKAIPNLLTLTSTRRRIFSFIAAQAEPPSIAQISQAMGAHSNTIREHVEQLVAESLVVARTKKPRGRGRPATVYRVVVPAWEILAGEYLGLIEALVSCFDMDDPQYYAHCYDVGRSWAGRMLTRSYVDSSDGTIGVEDAANLLSVLGFDATFADNCIDLRACPLIHDGDLPPRAVCAIHKGLIDTLLGTDPAKGSIKFLAGPSGPNTGTTSGKHTQLRVYTPQSTCQFIITGEHDE
ncbi:MAG: hypothetical protein Q4A71_05895 [Actinomycetaceae bacterium]|nr:hypothetical protein [Actinomycetaceae bacterium]